MDLTKKDLAILLSKFEGFKTPKVKFEQYELDGESASNFLWLMKDDLFGEDVLDLGCGTGILTIGSSILGANLSVGVDIDYSAISVALVNRRMAEEFFGKLKVFFICGDIRKINFKKNFLVIMNPPFGVQRKGADKIFLENAFRLGYKVWTLLSYNSKPFVEKISKEHGFTITFYTKIKIQLKQKFFFHSSKVKLIKADVFRLEKTEKITEIKDNGNLAKISFKMKNLKNRE